jgi:hypothetical protein
MSQTARKVSGLITSSDADFGKLSLDTLCLTDNESIQAFAAVDCALLEAAVTQVKNLRGTYGCTRLAQLKINILGSELDMDSFMFLFPLHQYLSLLATSHTKRDVWFCIEDGHELDASLFKDAQGTFFSDMNRSIQ